MVGGARQWGWVVSVFMVSCVAGQLPLSITPAAPLSRRNIIRNQMRKVLAGNNGYIPILSYLRVRGGGIPPAEQPPRFTTRQSAPTNARTPYSPDRSRNDPNWIYMVPDINGNLKPVRRKDNLRRLNLPVITPVEPRAPIIDPSLTDVLSNAVDTSSKVSNVAAEGTSRQNPTRTVPIEGIVIDTNGKSNVLNNSPTYSNPAVGTQDRNSLFAATGDGTPLSNEMGLTATRPDVLPGPLVVQNGAWNNPATAGPLNQMQDNSPVRPPLERVVDTTGWAVPDATALPNTWVPALPGGETQQRTAEQVPIGAVPEPGLSRPNQPTDLNTGVSLALIRATIMEQAKRLSANNDPNNPNPPAMLNLTAILELIYGPSNSVETVHTANVPTSVDSTNTANAYPYESSVAVDPVQTPVSSYDATAPIASEPNRGVYVEWSNTPTGTATTYEAHAHPSSGSADPAHTYSNQWPTTLTTSNQFLDTTANRLPSQVPPLPPAVEQAIPVTALPTPLQIEVATPPSPVAELPATTEPPLVNISVLGLSTDYGLFDLNMTMNMTTPSVNVTEMTTTASTTPSTTPFGSMNSVCGHHLVNHPDMPPPPTTTAPPVPTTDYYYYYSWFQPPRRPMYRHTQTHAEYEAPEPGEGPAYANGAPTPPPPPGQCICMEKAECEGVGVPQGAPYNYMCDETKGLGCCCEAP